MPVTLADIAEALGVSMMTVSRAINNRPAISAALRAWIAERELSQAIFAVNDSAVIGALSALHEAGLKVPAEVAVSGAGAINYGVLLRVPLTTVDWDLTEMGQQAARLLIETIEGHQPKNGGQRNIIIKPKLVVRNSCGSNNVRQAQ